MVAKIKYMMVAVALFFAAAADAQGIGDILKGIGGAGKDAGSTIGNLVEGIFTKTDLTLSDLEGEFVSEGPAVAFKSDNFLQKAGGLAGAAAIETKLKPYFEQYGLTGMTLVVDSAANFTMNIKGLRLSGDIAPKSEKGLFTFNVKAMGMKVGQFTTYIQKSGSDLDLMFDATKLKQLISTVTKLTGSKMAKTVGTVLDSYDGMCVGFDMKCTKKPENSGSGVGSAIESLKNILNRM